MPDPYQESQTVNRVAAHEPPIQNKTAALQAAIHNLDEAIGALIVRITPVLGPDFADEKGSDPRTAPEGSELTVFLTKETDKLYTLERIINNVINRLEL